MPTEGLRGLGRWDFSALHDAIEARCVGRCLTADDAAAEIGVAPAMLYKVNAGRGTIGISTLVRMAIWVGRPAADFFK